VSDLEKKNKKQELDTLNVRVPHIDSEGKEMNSLIKIRFIRAIIRVRNKTFLGLKYRK